MKTLKIILLGLIINLNTMVKADDFFLPEISAPIENILEGIETKLTLEDIAEILPWAKNSKSRLDDLLENTEANFSKDSLERILVSGIQKIVNSSGPKHTELLMRYVLNRAIKIHEILVNETNTKEIGVLDQRIRFLVQSIELAKYYYKSDLDFLNQGRENFRPLNFAYFGIRYSHFLGELSKSLFDASAQYQIERLNLGFLQWDLYRDLENKKYAPVINKIYNQLDVLPVESPSNDQSSVSFIRKIKKIRKVNLRSIQIEKEFEERGELEDERELEERRRLDIKKILKVGEIVYIPLEYNIMVKVVAVHSNNKEYVIKYLNGPLTGKRKSGVARKRLAVPFGCKDTHCVGDRKILDDHGYMYRVEIVAFEFSGKMILKILTAEYGNKSDVGALKNNWETKDLLRTTGCHENLCVGDVVFKYSTKVKILGIQSKGTFVVKYLDGQDKGNVRGGIKTPHLVK